LGTLWALVGKEIFLGGGDLVFDFDLTVSECLSDLVPDLEAAVSRCLSDQVFDMTVTVSE